MSCWPSRRRARDERRDVLSGRSGAVGVRGGIMVDVGEEKSSSRAGEQRKDEKMLEISGELAS